MRLQSLFPVLLLIASLASLPSCKKDHNSQETIVCPPGANKLGIDLQATFNRDQVTVYIDQQKMFSNVVETNQLLGLAANMTTSINSGDHTIKVVVNGSKTLTEAFKLDKDTYIGIGLDAGKITVKYSTAPYGYN